MSVLRTWLISVQIFYVFQTRAQPKNMTKVSMSFSPVPPSFKCSWLLKFSFLCSLKNILSQISMYVLTRTEIQLSYVSIGLYFPNPFRIKLNQGVQVLLVYYYFVKIVYCKLYKLSWFGTHTLIIFDQKLYRRMEIIFLVTVLNIASNL